MKEKEKKKKKKKSFIIVTVLYNTNSISFIVHANSEFNDVCGDLSLSKANDLTAWQWKYGLRHLSP